MSVWVTEEVVRWGLRFYRRRSLWQQRRFLATTSIKDSSFHSRHLAHVWTLKQNRTWLCRSLVSSVRFYSQDRNHSDGLDQRDHLPSPSEQAILPPKIQSDDTATEGRRLVSLRDTLPQCSSPSDVLDFTSRYKPAVQEISSCLSHMWSTTKKMTDEQRRCVLQLMFEHEAFEKLLQNAMRSVEHMSNEDMAFCLLSMVKLGVPQRSHVIQVFLRNCQERVNDFDERSLSILASVLKNMEDSPNVDALKEGMSLIVETRLPEIKNVLALQTMMHVLGKDAPDHLKWKLERKAMSMADQFSLPNAHYMITIMAAMNFRSKLLLDVCSTKIRENVHGIPFSRLLKLLVDYRELRYRDVTLLTNLSDYIASTLDMWPEKQLSFFLFKFEDLNFCPASFMEAYAKKVIANPDVLTLRDLVCVLKVYSSFNYDLGDQRQQFLDSLTRAVDSYLPKLSPFSLLKVVYPFCLLGHFPSAPLEQLLQSSKLEELEEFKSLKRRDKVLRTVDLCLRLDRPRLLQPLTVPASFLEDSFVPHDLPANPRLSEILKRLQRDQGDAELQEMVVVENFYVIDGLITPNKASADERSPAESSQRIAVIYAPPSSFCYGTSHHRGELATKIRHLKSLGYTPVLITEQELRTQGQTGDTDQKRSLKQSSSDLED